MKGSWRVGRIAGIEIGIHYTWLLALFIFTWLVGQGFTTTYPGWHSYLYWIAGFLATFTLFISVLIHELAHSLVARARGLAVSSITLFILGGVSNLTEEPEKPGVEFTMAIAGPLASLVLGAVFWILWYAITKTWVLPVSSVNVPTNKQTLALAIIGILAYANIALTIFNLLPGFPLDGGRVFRSILWGASGNLNKATNIATIVGRIFGWGFIALGVWIAFFVSGGLVNGIWLIFIGWFLNSAADNSRREVTLKEHLTGVLVEQIMQKDIESVHPNTNVADLVQMIFVQEHKRAIPVTESDNLVGIVTVSDIKNLPQEKWQTTPVEQIMNKGTLYTVKPGDDLSRVMKLIAEHDLNQIPVMSQVKLVGIITRADVINYLHLSQELNLKGKRKSGTSGAEVKS
jgi:Zn-dependent protease/CBS domain-containing protein